jgi:HlyD family secretion protein
MFEMLRRVLLLFVVAATIAAAAYSLLGPKTTTLVLTGIVTTNDVTVSPQIEGRIASLGVAEGDVVRHDQVLAVLDPRELRAESAFYSSSEAGVSAQVREAAAALRYQEQQTGQQIAQADSNLAAAQAQQAEARAALENARLAFERTTRLAQEKVASTQELDQARTAHEAAQAHADALNKQVEAQRATLAMARSNAQQTSVRRSQLENNEHLQQAAAAQRAKADVRLAYTEVRAPIDGIVDVRAVRVGEVVTPGQPLLTLINPDDLWVRVDIEETYIDRIRLDDRLQVRLPSGETREGVVIYRGANASFATERDVSRTKRDIKTFEVRLRVDNRDRRLAVGLTAYVLLPVPR